MEQTNRYSKRLETITDLERNLPIGSKEYYKHYYPKLNKVKDLEDHLGLGGRLNDISVKRKDYTKRQKFRSNMGEYAKMHYERTYTPGLSRSPKK